MKKNNKLFDTCHLTPVVFHLITTLYTFSSYKSCRKFGDVAAGGLVIGRVIFFAKGLNRSQLIAFKKKQTCSTSSYSAGQQTQPKAEKISEINGAVALLSVTNIQKGRVLP